MFSFDVADLGLIDYKKCLLRQQKLSREISSGESGSCLFLCEHQPVITLGRTAKRENILRPYNSLQCRGIGVVRADRGGDVTIHLPGQLVAYPVFDLRLLGRDIGAFLRNLEKAVILLLNDYGIEPFRKEGQAGVWVGKMKIASIGIAVHRWVSSHGLSLNIGCDLDLFSLIRPCGQDIIMTSLAELAPAKTVDMPKIKKQLADKFKQVFSGGGYS